MPAGSDLTQTQASQIRLETADLGKTFASHRRAVGDAAREASAGGLVPDSQADVLCAKTHIVFAEPKLDEDAPNACIFRGFEAGAVIAEVVDIGAVEHVEHAPFEFLLLCNFIELALAMKAPVASIGDISRPLDLVGFDGLVVCANLPCNGNGCLFLEWRKAWRYGGQAYGTVSQDLMRDGQYERAVDPPGIANDSAIHFAQKRTQTVQARQGPKTLPKTLVVTRVGALVLHEEACSTACVPSP